MPTKAIGDSMVLFIRQGARASGPLVLELELQNHPLGAFVIISMHTFADLTLKYFISSPNGRATFALFRFLLGAKSTVCEPGVLIESSPFAARQQKTHRKKNGSRPPDHRQRDL